MDNYDKTTCPECGSEDADRQYGGERGEVGPYVYCDECDYDEEQEYKDARARLYSAKRDVMAAAKALWHASSGNAFHMENCDHWLFALLEAAGRLIKEETRQ